MQERIAGAGACMGSLAKPVLTDPRGQVVAIGPAHLTIDHEVSEGTTAVVIEGPPPLVLAYAPAARLALTRLANLARAG